MDNKAQAPQSTRRLSDILRETRVAKGLELSDVAEVTHVRKEYLKALDEGRYEDLPEDVYARNFVRLYAQTLGISDTQLLEKFKRERAAAREGAANAASVAAYPAPAREAVSPAAAPRAPQVSVPAGAGEAGAATHRPPPEPSPSARDAAERPPRSGAHSRPSAPAVIPVTRRSARDQAAANLDRDFWNGDPSRRRGGLLLWLAGLIVLALVGAGIWWAASSLRPGPVGDAPPATTPPATTTPTVPGDATGPAIIPLEPSANATATPGESAAPPPSSVTLSVTSTPPGAEVSVDNFYLGNTPLQFPIRARESGVIRLTLDGYQTAEFSEPLSSNRTFNVELQAVGANADATVATSGQSEAAGGGGSIVITVETGPSWLEVWGGGARNEGERLLFTTAEPGQRFEFPLPVYVHAGAASNIRVSLNGQPAGALGSGGEVVGRLFR